MATVCESARCPNLGECFSQGEATFLLMGEVCTRDCRFCAVQTGKPAPLDEDEPRRVALATKELGLKHVVLTCVTRDDLADGGAAHFAAAISAMRKLAPWASVEVLAPDFRGDCDAVKTVVQAAPEIFAHNMETVSRLYPQVRPQADWERSLEVLRCAKKCRPSLLIKSGLMLGLGETREEILDALGQLRRVGTDFLTLGQYLQPTQNHLPVVKYLPPEAYRELAAEAKEMGFREVLAGPLVRSSYHAGEMARLEEHREPV